VMEERGFIDGVGRAATEAETIVLLQAAAGAAPSSLARKLAPHFVDWVLAGLPSARRAQGGVVRTTLVLGLQARLEAAVRAHLEERRSLGLRQAGVVVLDPATGAVLAMVGSVDYGGAGGQVNITTTLRHPGSTLKPFIYALALEDGDSPASLAAD